jgi:hypothetical protein
LNNYYGDSTLNVLKPVIRYSQPPPYFCAPDCGAEGLCIKPNTCMCAIDFCTLPAPTTTAPSPTTPITTTMTTTAKAATTPLPTFVQQSTSAALSVSATTGSTSHVAVRNSLPA